MIRVLMLALALIGPMVLGSQASMAADSADEAAGEEAAATPGWIPGLSLSLNIFDLTGTASIASQPPVLQSLSPTSNSLTIARFRAGLDLLSPEIDLGPTKARLAIFGGFMGGPKENVVIGSTGQFVGNQPDSDIILSFNNFASRTSNPVPGSAIRGQGTELLLTNRGLGWYAGIGVEFPMPGIEKYVKVRPYAAYQGEKLQINGRLIHVSDPFFGTRQNPNPPFDTEPAFAFYATYSDETQSNEDIHYIGPGLGFDVVLSDGEKLLLSFFTTGELLFNVGSRDITVDGETSDVVFNCTTVVVREFPNQPRLLRCDNSQADLPTSSPVNYTYRADQLRFNLQFGLRFAFKNLFGRD